MIYISIFVLKLIENSLGTLRLILISNGKKVSGSLLQFICSIIFVISASLAIINDDLYKILVFALGCTVGSYIGCIFEQKLAIGNIMITCITENINLINHLRNNGYIVTVLNGEGIKNDKYILFIMINRTNLSNLKSIIKEFDKNTILVSENINVLN